MVSSSPLSDESRDLLRRLQDQLSAGDEAVRLLAFLDERAGQFDIDIEAGEQFTDALRREYLKVYPPPIPPVSGPGRGPMQGSGE